MKTLHRVCRVTDLTVSLDFYCALGYREAGRISLGDGATLSVLKLASEGAVTLELVHRPADGPCRSARGSATSSSRSTNLPAPSPRWCKVGYIRNPSNIPLVRWARGRPGWPTRMATGSSWCSGRPGTPTGSPPTTSREVRTGLATLRLDAERLDAICKALSSHRLLTSHRLVAEGIVRVVVRHAITFVAKESPG